MIVFIVNSNRTLFPLLIITFYQLFKLDPVIVFNFIFCWTFFSLLIFQFASILYGLFIETQLQIIGSESDARVRSLIAWLTYPQNFLEFVFGSGYDSLSSTYGKQIYNLKEYSGVYRSDLGIIGYWSMFGLIALVPIVRLVLKTVYNRNKYPKYIFAIAIHMLIMPIAFVFWKPGGAIFVALLFYLYDLNYSSYLLKMRKKKSLDL